MNTENFSPQESLKLITNMIEKTKQDISYNSHYFLLWGWAGFLAFISQYILKTQLNYKHHYVVWLITFVCLIVMIIWMRRDRKLQGAKTYVGESMGHLWSGIGISFFVISMILAKIGFQYCNPFYILLYGVGTFISGRLIQFKPLIIGGVLNFMLAIGAAYVEYDYQMLFGAAAILTSYIIPGHILRSKFSKPGSNPQHPLHPVNPGPEHPFTSSPKDSSNKS